MRIRDSTYDKAYADEMRRLKEKKAREDARRDFERIERERMGL